LALDGGDWKPSRPGCFTAGVRAKRGNEFPQLRIELRFFGRLACSLLCALAPEIRQNNKQNVGLRLIANTLCCVAFQRPTR